MTICIVVGTHGDDTSETCEQVKGLFSFATAILQARCSPHTVAVLVTPIAARKEFGQPCAGAGQDSRSDFCLFYGKIPRTQNDFRLVTSVYLTSLRRARARP